MQSLIKKKHSDFGGGSFTLTLVGTIGKNKIEKNEFATTVEPRS